MLFFVEEVLHTNRFSHRGVTSRRRFILNNRGFHSGNHDALIKLFLQTIRFVDSIISNSRCAFNIIFGTQKERQFHQNYRSFLVWERRASMASGLRVFLTKPQTPLKTKGICSSPSQNAIHLPPTRITKKADISEYLWPWFHCSFRKGCTPSVPIKHPLFMIWKLVDILYCPTQFGRHVYCGRKEKRSVPVSQHEDFRPDILWQVLFMTVPKMPFSFIWKLNDIWQRKVKMRFIVWDVFREKWLHKREKRHRLS